MGEYNSTKNTNKPFLSKPSVNIIEKEKIKGGLKGHIIKPNRPN